MAKDRGVICDTNIVIELFKNNNKVIKECMDIGVNNLCISAITVGEFYYGALNKREIKSIRKHLSQFAVLPINESISSIFVELMQNYCLSYKPFIGDMLIAATALYYDVEIYSLNRSDFHFISNLKLYNAVS